jgi:tetratricopeptide (TPR) repeat protein
LSRGDVKQALVYLRRGLRIATEIGAKEFEKEAYEYTAKAYAQSENYQRAYEYHQRYTNIRDSLFSSENFAKISSLQNKFKTEQNEKKLQLASKDKLIEKAIQKRNFWRNISIGVSIAFVLLLGWVVFSKMQANQRASNALDLNTPNSPKKEEEAV